MKEKLQRFMLGRYGVDAFSKFLFVIFLVLWVLNMFVGSALLSSWAILVLIYSYYRIFSRNVTKRYQENQKYLQFKNKLFSKFKTNQSHTKQTENHRIYRCPSCKQKIRVPKGKGRIRITCPKCKAEFIKKS